MPTINYVVEGKFKGKKISGGTLTIYDSLGKDHKINKRYVVSYEVIDETKKEKYSMWKGALGVAFLGGIGAIAGIKGNKKKEYLIAIEWVNNQWEDGGKSLILLDENLYKTFIKQMF